MSETERRERIVVRDVNPHAAAVSRKDGDDGTRPLDLLGCIQDGRDKSEASSLRQVDREQRPSAILLTDDPAEAAGWETAAEAASIRVASCPRDEANDKRLSDEAVSVIVSVPDVGATLRRAEPQSILLRRLPTILVIDDGMLSPGDMEGVYVWAVVSPAVTPDWLPTLLQAAASYGAAVQRMYAFVTDYSRKFAALPERERQVLHSVSAGVTNRAIAERVDVSVRTIENCRSRIFDAFGVKNAAGLAALVATVRVYVQMLRPE